MAQIPFPHVHEPGGQDDANLAFGLVQMGADGAAHIFVDPVEGNDANDGRAPDDPTNVSGAVQSTGPFRTIQKALDHAQAWLSLGLEQDLVVELANGVYAEDVRILPVGLRRRLIIRGDRDNMTVVAAGLVTGAGISSIVDGLAAFGDLGGLVLTVFDPLNQAATQQWMTIRSNGPVAIQPDVVFFPIPVAGWRYEVLRPAAIIAGGAQIPFSSNIQCGVVQQTAGSAVSPQIQSIKLPAVIFAWIQCGDPAFPLRQGWQCDGGDVCFVGCVYEGGGIGLFAAACGVTTGQLVSFEADPVFGLGPLDFQTLAGAGIGIRSSFAFSATRLFASSLFGSGFFRGGVELFDNSDFFIFGGSIQGPTGLVLHASQIGLLIGGGDPSLPFLFAVIAADAITLDSESSADIGGDVDFVAVGGLAILAQGDSFAHLFSPLTGVPPNIGALVAVDSQNGAGIQAAAGVGLPSPGTFGGTAGELRADGTVTTWGALAPGFPAIGLLSDAWIWRN